MVAIEPNLTSSEALTLCQRLHKKFKELDFDRALDHRENTVVTRHDLDELVAGLKKLEERLQWSV